MQTSENLGVGARHPSRGFPQPLTVGILADSQEELPDGTLRPLMIHPLRHRRLLPIPLSPFELLCH